MVRLFWTEKSMTLRFIFLCLAVVIASFFSIFISKASQAASLKSVAVISDNTIKLGDLFDNLPHNAEYVIGPAPQPGKDMTLNARTLYRIASALDLSWRPSSTTDQIIVRREATVVPYELIESKLRNGLKNQGVSGRYNINLSTKKPAIVLPFDMDESVEISSLSYDRNKDYFKATLVAPSADNPVQRIKVSGIIDRLVTVPILSKNLRNGDVIGDGDIEMIEISQNDLQHNMVTNKEKMIGMTPRRIAYAGKFVQDGTLIKPQLVQRGENVNITFTEGSLVLSAKGKALQSGAKGDIVRVTNANSSRTVDAIVSGSHQVIVR